VRVLPDGSLLISRALDGGPRDFDIVRLALDGTELQIYGTQECDEQGRGIWLGIALSPDGTSFWSSCQLGGDLHPVEFDVATGAALRTLSATGIVQAVYGGFRAAQDRTPPTATIHTPVHEASYTRGEHVVADYECTDLGGSDLASCVGTVPDGSLIDTASVGTTSFDVTATDGAGNTGSASATYQVVYDFSGFLYPVDNPPTLNVMPAGKAVKVAFRLGGNQGMGIFAPEYPQSHTIACDPTAPQDKVEKTTRASLSKLTYEMRPQQYVYYWATSISWRGGCRELVLKLVDGTEHRALVKFT
jgi:hypothetical protein